MGPIDLEYEQAFVRVGSSQDNDLVLPHKSVAPYHCLLVFRGEQLLLLPPSPEPPSTADLHALDGQEFGLGDSLSIGGVTFTLAHSSKTVALPELPSAPGAPKPSADASQHRYFCPHCQMVVPEAQLRRVGLVGRAKRLMCPKCSHMFDSEPPPAPPPPPPPPRPKKRWGLVR